MKLRLYIFIQCIVCTILFFSLKPLFFSFMEANACNLVVTDVFSLAQPLSIFNYHPLLQTLNNAPQIYTKLQRLLDFSNSKGN